MTAGKTKHVAVIGAGIAGLIAAYRLSHSGYRVTVLETQSRTGGRAVTIRSFFPEGLIGQAGPSRFLGDFQRVFHYAGKFGLELCPYYPGSGTVVAYFKGKRIAEYHPSPEEYWGYTAIVKRKPGRIESLAMEFALWLRALAKRILRKRPFMTYGIRGGTELLTDALAAATDADFRLNTTVKTVTQDVNGVRVGFAGPQSEGTVEADYVVCAVPLSVATDIALSPPAALEKTKLMEEVPFRSAIRVFMQMSRAYWRDPGHNGFAVTDTLGEIWDPHHDGPEEPALLVCYAQGQLARQLGQRSESERIEHTLEELEKVFPGAKTHFVKGISYYWDEQPWIRGGWPLVRQGFSNRVRVFREPDGRVYYAGDYAASPDLLNTMEGAIESGEYVAREIHRRIGAE